jgi:hypothetical protein
VEILDKESLDEVTGYFVTNLVASSTAFLSPGLLLGNGRAERFYYDPRQHEYQAQKYLAVPHNVFF